MQQVLSVQVRASSAGSRWVQATSMDSKILLAGHGWLWGRRGWRVAIFRSVDWRSRGQYAHAMDPMQHLGALYVDDREQQRKNCCIACKIGDFRLSADEVLRGRLRRDAQGGEGGAPGGSRVIMLVRLPLISDASCAFDTFCEVFVAKDFNAYPYGSQRFAPFACWLQDRLLSVAAYGRMNCEWRRNSEWTNGDASLSLSAPMTLRVDALVLGEHPCVLLPAS
ncbi:hypothetical protein PHYSODRAFT_322950 [Phytophthora sojae]|uniref:Uncharacterized protein n=1 Tax=Phytophthora sojae (strain P6497) TaxID=1094619 RepID=G4YJ96_PHYSP|nr:hypothetical protein PHYSODRAFT_322950 [Phytophthora sojae]EGZ29430.1 hypothetical protein PHYSODRAFT_322950 [Phytophthora sojae]|eukprot:XP_009516705.1 hypothetical protein PHYSODRAFT_322950 [Phytophthora sojae]